MFVSVLYLGGWDFSIPFITEYFNISPNETLMNFLNGFMGLAVIITKAYLFVFLTILTRWTLPRVRMDQLLDLGWKFLLPVALGNLLLTASFQITLI